jgi:hypothetical protein
LHWTKDCNCGRWMTNSKTIEFFKISDSRTEIRCSRCHGLIGWRDEPSRVRKIMPSKREWTANECLDMR